MRLAIEATASRTQEKAGKEIDSSRRRANMADLTITGCSVTTNSITITFSDPVDTTSPLGSTSALDPGNYTIYDPPNFPPGTNPPAAGSSADGQTVTFTLNQAFGPGDFVLIGVSNIALASDPGNPALIDDPVSISRQVPGTDPTARTTKDVEDAISYPVLTEEIGYRPSPVGIPTGGGGGFSGGGGVASIGQIALKAVGDVLGWKPNSADPKGFVGALTQSFTLTDVEGHVESAWTPRTYAVQTDLGGGITGAQASLYTRAKDALDNTLPLLDGLYPLDPEADPEYVKALREMARSQMTEIVKELGTVGLPSILRIDTYFRILLGQSGPPIEFEPDDVDGTLGQLRDTYGIFFLNNKLSNSVEDEQDITNFRVVSDYMTSLLQSWVSNRDFFRLGRDKPAFFGTQLVLISRQFNVITETVNEVRFALDSVFIGPSERQTLLLIFEDGSAPMFLEDVLVEVESFATDEGPRLLRDGGRISVTNNILPVVQSLQNLVEQAHDPTNINDLPDGFQTARVRRSLDDLQDQLEALIKLIRQVEQAVPAPEGKLTISGVTVPGNPTTYYSNNIVFSIFGDGFEPGAGVTIDSTTEWVVPAQYVQFYSAQRIDVTIEPTTPTWPGLTETGSHDVTVTNPDGESVTFFNAFSYDATTGGFGGAMKRKTLSGKSAARPGGSARPPAKPPAPGGGVGAPLVGKAGAKPIPPSPPAAGPGGAGAVAALQGQLQKLQQSHDELKDAHKTVLEKLGGMEESIVAKLSDLFKGKGKKDKDD
jgi:hypothetical protein